MCKFWVIITTETKLFAVIGQFKTFPNLTNAITSELGLRIMSRNFFLLHLKKSLFMGWYPEAATGRCSERKGVLIDFAKLTGKQLCQSPFFYKKKFWQKCFPVKFAKFFKTSFSQNTSSGCFCSFKLIKCFYFSNQRNFHPIDSVINPSWNISGFTERNCRFFKFDFSMINLKQQDPCLFLFVEDIPFTGSHNMV